MYNPLPTLLLSTAAASRPFMWTLKSILSHLGLGSVLSIAPSESLAPQETARTAPNEKVVESRYQDPPNIPIAYFPDHTQMEWEEEEAFMSFLRDYPGKEAC